MMEIEELKDVGEKTAEKLKEAGYDEISKIANADLEDLIQKTGLTESKAEKIIESAKNIENIKPFNLENELKKEKKYLQSGFLLYIRKKGYDVNTIEKYNLYMKEYKEA